MRLWAGTAGRHRRQANGQEGRTVQNSEKWRPLELRKFGAAAGYWSPDMTIRPDRPTLARPKCAERTVQSSQCWPGLAFHFVSATVTSSPNSATDNLLSSCSCQVGRHHRTEAYKHAAAAAAAAAAARVHRQRTPPQLHAVTSFSPGCSARSRVGLRARRNDAAGGAAAGPAGVRPSLRRVVLRSARVRRIRVVVGPGCACAECALCRVCRACIVQSVHCVCLLFVVCDCLCVCSACDHD